LGAAGIEENKGELKVGAAGIEEIKDELKAGASGTNAEFPLEFLF
jgi:hypothetical protein